MAGVKPFSAYIIWGAMSTTIILLPLKISPPSLIGHSPPQWKVEDLRIGTDNHSLGVFLNGIERKVLSFWILREHII